VIWVRGQIVANDALVISALDRTFEHGLGLFETLRTWNGHASLLPRHLQRLAHSAGELGIPLDPEALPDPHALRSLALADGRDGDAIFRITLSGGISASHGSTLWVRTFPLLQDAVDHGLVLGPVRPVRTDPLAHHKTLNYWPNRQMYEQARTEGFDECVTVSPDGNLWEGSRSNLFVVEGDRLLTPPVSGAILPGIMRGLILEHGARLGLDVQETPLGLFDGLFQPEEVFLCNSVRGIMPVRAWGEARYPAPGPATRRLWDEIKRLLNAGGET
jgi:branched-subunit amino acid aminotransferase/4-amino-4-deoxychorismate lyase